jgi:hypothetical protein
MYGFGNGNNGNNENVNQSILNFLNTCYSTDSFLKILTEKYSIINMLMEQNRFSQQTNNPNQAEIQMQLNQHVMSVLMLFQQNNINTNMLPNFNMPNQYNNNYQENTGQNISNQIQEFTNAGYDYSNTGINIKNEAFNVNVHDMINNQQNLEYGSKQGASKVSFLLTLDDIFKWK